MIEPIVSGFRKQKNHQHTFGRRGSTELTLDWESRVLYVHYSSSGKRIVVIEQIERP